MTGPEHYRHAERLLAQAAQDYGDSPATPDMIAAAQVHATLAATASNVALFTEPPGHILDAWHAVTGGSDD